MKIIYFILVAYFLLAFIFLAGSMALIEFPEDKHWSIRLVLAFIGFWWALPMLLIGTVMVSFSETILFRFFDVEG